ncbi:uncharacterized protein LOC143244034 isoform X2 [Tachypleus tridentatus]|uniref:uncharacterized protein LOC143244034 isoform X2 n=1 Tax=Tachypleus tridentatus TaxID=6853 RepID=UPI003FD449D5
MRRNAAKIIVLLQLFIQAAQLIDEVSIISNNRKPQHHLPLQTDSRISFETSTTESLFNQADHSLEAVREIPYLQSSPEDVVFDKITRNESHVEEDDPGIHKSFGYKVTIYSQPFGYDTKPTVGNHLFVSDIGKFGENIQPEDLEEAADSSPQDILPAHNKGATKPLFNNHDQESQVTNQDNVHRSKTLSGYDRGLRDHEKTVMGCDRGSHRHEEGSHQHLKDHEGHMHGIRSHDKAGLAEEGYREKAEIEYYEREHFLDKERAKRKRDRDKNKGLFELQAHDQHSSQDHENFNKASRYEDETLLYGITSGKVNTYQDGIHRRENHLENKNDELYSDDDQTKRKEGLKERGYKITTEREFYRKKAHHDKGFGRHDSTINEHEHTNKDYHKDIGQHDRGFITEVKDHEVHDSAHKVNEDHQQRFNNNDFSKTFPVKSYIQPDQEAYGSSVVIGGKPYIQLIPTDKSNNPATRSDQKAYGSSAVDGGRPYIQPIPAYKTNNSAIQSDQEAYSSSDVVDSRLSIQSILGSHRLTEVNTDNNPTAEFGQRLPSTLFLPQNESVTIQSENLPTSFLKSHVALNTPENYTKKPHLQISTIGKFSGPAEDIPEPGPLITSGYPRKHKPTSNFKIHSQYSPNNKHTFSSPFRSLILSSSYTKSPLTSHPEKSSQKLQGEPGNVNIYPIRRKFDTRYSNLPSRAHDDIRYYQPSVNRGNDATYNIPLEGQTYDDKYLRHLNRPNVDIRYVQSPTTSRYKHRQPKQLVTAIPYASYLKYSKPSHNKKYFIKENDNSRHRVNRPYDYTNHKQRHGQVSVMLPGLYYGNHNQEQTPPRIYYDDQNQQQIPSGHYYYN